MQLNKNASCNPFNYLRCYHLCKNNPFTQRNRGPCGACKVGTAMDNDLSNAGDQFMCFDIYLIEELYVCLSKFGELYPIK